ncbi:PilN domain-containing protein [Azohydromonas aeria]|uniref:PilN domain-containing protein n=1 Tax=Azohydromonas aeria TaxID=2590212 RepID=UPI0012F9AC1D|nr:PilN domain-containing protein [Azohydromonas aeria]
MGIGINLLPHREARRQRRRRAWRAALAASAGVGLLVALLGYAALQQRTAAQQRRNDLLMAEAAALEAPLQAAARLRADIAALQSRRQALLALQFERRRPVLLLQALSRHAGAGVQLTSLRQRGDRVTLGGVALGSAEVAALVSTLAGAAPVLRQPTLVELKAAAPTAAAPRRFEFAIELRLQSAAEALSDSAPVADPPAPAGARPAGAVS